MKHSYSQSIFSFPGTKKLLFFWLTLSTLVFAMCDVSAQCLTATNGQYPTTNFTPSGTCNGTSQVITTVGYAGEYSKVVLPANVAYTFTSSVSTDFITISNNGGGVALTSGTTPVTYTAPSAVTVRFYTHTNSACGEAAVSRTRAIFCGTAPTPTCNTLLTPANGATGISTQPTPLTFNAATNASSYDVYLGVTNTPPLLGNTTATSVTVSGLLSGTTYFWYTVPKNAAGAAPSGCISNIRSFTTTVGPANDECTGAPTLVMNGAAISGTTVNADQSASPLSCSSSTSSFAYDVWYKFTAINTTQTVTVVGGSGFDAVVQAYSGSCAALVSLGCVDVSGAAGTETLAMSGLTICNTYYIRVYGYGTTGTPTGTFTVKVAGTSSLTALTSASASPNPVCNDGLAGNITLTATGGTGGTIKWYAGSCGTALQGSGSPLVIAKPTVATTYFARRETTCGNDVTACVSVTVAVNQKSADPTSASASATTICSGVSTIVTLNGGGGGTGEVIRWYAGSCGGTLVGSGNNLSVSPTSTTTYYGRYEDGAPCNYNSLCASVTITVSPNANAGTVSGASPLCVNATASYSSNGNPGGSFSSDNTSVATVDAATGVVTGIAPGTANIIYTVSTGCNSPVAASTLVTVNPNYTVTASAGANGTISPNGVTTLSCDGTGNQAYTITAAACYHINDVLVDGVSVGAVSTYSFDNVTTSHTISASFSINIYTLTYTAGANGTITGITPQTVNCGADGTAVTAVADACYSFVNWSDGSTDNPRTDLNVQANISVTANFAINTYTLTYTAGANGSITGTSPQTVNCGSDGTAVTALPDACYSFVNWSDGSTANPRTDLNVQGNINVTANFAINTYTLTYTAGANGSITGTSPQTVDCGADGTAVTAVADACYSFVNWSDGLTDNPRTDLNVQANISVTANFAINTYTLTYTAGANGTITGTSPQTVNCGANGTAVTAVADACYSFVNWSDGSTDNPRADLNVQANITVTANFAINTYTLTYTAGANGTITGTSPQTVNCGDNGTAVTAVADACYSFVNWSDGSTDNPRTDLNVQGNISVTANFAINTYTLTYTAGANGSITGTSPQTVDCGADGTAVTAVADACYSFVNWSDGSIANPRTDLNVQGNINVTANFAINTYTLTYTASTGGTISGISPQTVNCGADGSTVTAVADACYTFTGWSDGVLTASRTDFNVQANISVTANFVINTYTLTYTAGANGTITGTSPQTVNCGDNGTAVTAVADACYSFVNWSDGSTDNPRTDLNVQGNISVTANFAINTYTLTYTAGANGSITGTSPQTVNCGSDGTAVTALPDACYSFVNWSDGSTANPRTDLNVQANISVTANFAINTYTLTYTAGANGTITGTSPQTVNCGDNGTAVTAVADACYSFVNWSDGSTDNPRTDLNVQGNISVTANFAINTYTLTYTTGANGSITGTSPQTVNCGSDGTAVTALPDACYSFVNWSDGSTANPRTDLNVQANISVTANFAINTYTLTYTAGANGSITGVSPQTVNCGADGTAVTAVANACYSFVNWSDGSTANPRTDLNVQANITVTANFAINTFIITATSGANGTVTPAGASTVNCGNNSTYSITPAACYHVNDVLVDGVSVGAVTTYTFTNVQANHTISASFVADAPLTAPVITGPVNSCQYIGTGEGVTYTFNSPGATGYSYVLPPNTMLQSSTANSITITFQNGFAAQGNRQIRVTALSPCGNSPVGIFYLAAQAPVTPSQIVGNTNVCAIIGTANTYTYTIPSVPGASSYNWTAQSGTTTISHPNGLGVNDTTITISFTNGFTTSNLTVAAVNGCSSSTARSLTIQRINPTVPALISGPTNVCENILPAGTPATYRIVKVAGATSYNWTVTPNTAVVTHPNGSGVQDTVITVTFQAGFTSGTVTVSASNGCGTSGVRSLGLTKLTPGSPSAFDVIQLTQCPNRSYSYTLPSLPANTTSLQWTVPTSQGAVITSQTATSITVSYPATAVNGTVTVQAFNNCGSSPVRSKQINLAICATEEPRLAANGTKTAAAESFSVNVFPNPSVADFKLQVLTAGREKVNVRILDMQARVYKQFTVMPYQTTTIGSELKAGAYLLEVTQGSTVKTTKLLKF